MTIQVALTIDDKGLEVGIQQAIADAKQQGTPPDVFLANVARSGFEQFRGAERRAAAASLADLVAAVDPSDPTQVAALQDVLAFAQQHLGGK